MAYNNGREDRKWRIWKEAEEKVLREHGVDEATIEQIRIAIFFSLHLILLHEFSSNNCTTENYLNQLFTTCYQIYKR